MDFFFLFLTALLLNIPCGYIREAHPKFSFKWFLWIHASIPVLIWMRLSLEISPIYIPISLALAIIGQIIGSRLKQSRMSLEEKEALEQIPPIHTPVNSQIPLQETEVVLLNMGGPKTNEDVKDFQKRLFEDSLLIRFPLSFFLQKIFAAILIFFRLKSVKERYKELGLTQGGSPIYPSTENQTKALQDYFKSKNYPLSVSYSFNYSPPLPKDTMDDLKRRQKKYILPLSLYPHYSKATTGSNIFYLKKAAVKFYPQLKFIEPISYHLHDGYIQAFVDRIHETLRPQEKLSDFYLMFSAHGLPLYFLKEGDPYPFLIAQSVAKILTRLERDENWCICYQSAVGPFQWLKPSTDEMIKALASRGIDKLLIIPISFVGDHIETICEIDVEYREMAHKLGIKDYRMTKAIETHPAFIQSLAETVESSLGIRKTAVSQNNLHHKEKSSCA